MVFRNSRPVSARTSFRNPESTISTYRASNLRLKQVEKGRLANSEMSRQHLVINTRSSAFPPRERKSNVVPGVKLMKLIPFALRLSMWARALVVWQTMTIPDS